MPHDEYYTKPYTVIYDFGKIVIDISMTIYVYMISEEKNDWLLGRQNILETYIQFTSFPTKFTQVTMQKKLKMETPSL